MGQSQTGEPDDSNCFHTCFREKKFNSVKRAAAPFNPINQQHLEIPPFPQNIKSPDKNLREGSSPLKNTVHTKAFQTSIEQRLQGQVNHRGAEIAEATTNSQVQVSKKKIRHQQSPEEEEGILGLQSKFSSSRKTSLGKYKNITKITAVSEGLGTRSNWQKEQVSSEDTSSKSHGASTESTRSRKVLLNKIQEIKQKYYERQLEIEIYQNENQYQENLEEQITHEAQQQVHEPSKSQIRQPSTIRGKILEKLNKRKMQKNNPKKLKETNQNENTNNVEELELYSREGPRANLDEPSREQTKTINRTQELNRSRRALNNSHEMSMEERIQFSGYTQNETLQEIRQCDEQQEDYKSKVQSRVKTSQTNRSKPLSRRIANQTSLYSRKEVGPASREESIAPKQNQARRSIVMTERGQEVGQCVSTSNGNGGGGRDKVLLF